MTDTDRSTLQAYLDRPLDDLMEQLELYDPASRGPADAWNKVAGPVRQRLCVEWDWCQVRQDARWDDDLALALCAWRAVGTGASSVHPRRPGPDRRHCRQAGPRCLLRLSVAAE